MHFGAREPLNKHEMERIARIQRQSLQRYKEHGERVKHLADIRRRQLMQNYETEYDNLRAASTGPLHRAALQRLAELKTIVGR